MSGLLLKEVELELVFICQAILLQPPLPRQIIFDGSHNGLSLSPKNFQTFLGAKLLELASRVVSKTDHQLGGLGVMRDESEKDDLAMGFGLDR